MDGVVSWTDGIKDTIVGVGTGVTSLLIGIRSGPTSIAAGFEGSGDIDGTVEAGGVNGINGSDVADNLLLGEADGCAQDSQVSGQRVRAG